MNTVLMGVLIYLLVQFAVGVIVSRHIASEDDYLLAGRRLGLVLAAFSIFATWFGAETIVGAAGAIYDHGLSGGSADPFGYALCLIIYILDWTTPYVISLAAALIAYLVTALFEATRMVPVAAADEEFS